MLRGMFGLSPGGVGMRAEGGREERDMVEDEEE